MKYFILVIILTFAAFGLTACDTVAGATDAAALIHGEPTPYDPLRDAKADIEAALTEAKTEGKLGLLVFGANWCHDSRALAAHFEKPRFATLIRSHYKLAYVDVGQKDRNIDLAQQFGVEHIVGTPTIFVTNSDGEVLNLDTAPTWRNAASRDEDDVWTYFRNFVHPRL